MMRGAGAEHNPLTGLAATDIMVTIADMLRRRRHISYLLLALLALRALVPVGYMLALPATALAALPTLVLCPAQNIGLETARLDTVSSSHHHHAAAGESGAVVVDVQSTCALWLAGASTLVPNIAVGSSATAEVRQPPAPRERRIALAVHGRRPPARAPPATLV